MPSSGTWMAATPPTCGSISRISAIAKLSQAGQSVLLPAFEQVVQPGNLFGLRRHHQFSANLVRDAVLLAERDHLPDSGDRKPGLHRSWLVVEAAMQHAAVVAALVLPYAGFLLQHRNGGARKFLGQSQSGGQPDDSAANDGDAHFLSRYRISIAIIDLIHLSLPK